ncbi:MAG TPA: tellurite resistance/C4-dicarboxylate transporter family protein [Gaiellaceae bacterium]|jgi:tellurite resistance protein TehA-like permease|nr:tellurite resistance/C4-dicarboxylate transporter family protein [Gaiellaceae bacterium]
MSRAIAVAERLAAAAPPASGAVVMGTGIVSIGLSIDGYEPLSRALLAIAGLVWVVLAGVLALLILRLRPLLRAEARSAAALTGIAGTDVLGARVAMLGWNREAAALLVIGLLLWLVLVPYVLAHWRTPTVGVSFVLTVGTESLAVLGAALAIAFDETWLAVASLACVGLGLAFYLFVVSTFDLRQLLVGRGDHWVSGGALAIATLACAHTAEATAALDPLGSAAGSLETAALGIWAAAALWLPALVLGELASPRVEYDVRRWSTVFPLGMYSVCSFAVARIEDIGGIAHFARVWIWVAFAVWLLVFAGLLRRTLPVVTRSLRLGA